MRYREPLAGSVPTGRRGGKFGRVEGLPTGAHESTNGQGLPSATSEEVHTPIPRCDGASVHSLSVFAAWQDAKRALELPSLRGCPLCGAELGAVAGYIQQTGRSSHPTRWTLLDFNILARCTMEAL